MQEQLHVDSQKVMCGPFPVRVRFQPWFFVSEEAFRLWVFTSLFVSLRISARAVRIIVQGLSSLFKNGTIFRSCETSWISHQVRETPPVGRMTRLDSGTLILWQCGVGSHEQVQPRRQRWLRVEPRREHGTWCQDHGCTPTSSATTCCTLSSTACLG